MDIPPPQYVEYPRDMPPSDAAQKLRALASGYFGLNKAFFINILLSLGLNGLMAATTGQMKIIAALIGLLALGLGVFALVLPHNKSIGYGANWQPGTPLVVSILMAVNSVFCCGIIGYIWVQSIAGKEIKNYGVKSGFFGPKKKDIEARAAELEMERLA